MVFTVFFDQINAALARTIYFLKPLECVTDPRCLSSSAHYIDIYSTTVHIILPLNQLKACEIRHFKMPQSKKMTQMQ